MYIFVYFFIFAFSVGQSLSYRSLIEFFEDYDFKGSAENIHYDFRYTNPCTSFGLCHTLYDLNANVSSVNTHGNCIVMYSNDDCTGDSVYLGVGSPSHNNLTVIGFNDRMNSFTSCDLDEKTSSLIPGNPEYEFWQYMFSISSDEILEIFLQETERDGFISWKFLIPQRANRWITRQGDRYELALIIYMFLIGGKHIGNIDNLFILQTYMDQVVSDRENRLEPEDWTSHPYVVHRTILERWREFSGFLNTTMDGLMDDLIGEILLNETSTTKL